MNRWSIHRAFPLALLMLLVGSSAAGTIEMPTSTAQPSLSGQLSEANDLFDHAAKIRAQSMAESDRALDRSADIYQRLLISEDLSRAARASLEYNLGANRLLRGDLARAVFELRRAERSCPIEDPALRARITANLGLARQRLSPQNTATAAPADPTRMPIDWVYVAVDPGWRMLAGLVLVVSSSLGFIARTAGWRVRLLVPILALFAGGALAATVPHQAVRQRMSMQAVVMAPNVTARSGPDDVRFAAVGSALAQGLELRLLGSEQLGDQAPKWVRVERLLEPGSEFWVPRSAIQLIEP